MPDSQRARAAADGSAVDFASLSGFGDAQSLGVSTDYVSVRTAQAGTNGWATHGISPPQNPMVFAADLQFMEPLYWGEFSDDLSRGVYRAWSPVTDAPMVANEQNLYVRDDLRTPGAGSFHLLTDCPACATPLPPIADASLLSEQSFPAGASQDFSHVIFESRLPLTSDSTAKPDVPVWNLFEWDHGTVRLAGVLPDSACGSPPCPAPASQAGQGAMNAVYTPHTISANGTRIFFTVPPASGCPAGFTGCGDLYLRSDHASTAQLNVSERTVGPDPAGHQPAQYWDASTDGSRAFFVTSEALTDDAPATTDRKLYMYSVTPDSQGHHLTFVSADHQPADGMAGDNVNGVIGASDDGHTVYFTNDGGQLAAGEVTVVPGTSAKLFRWHDGTIDYLGAISAGDVQQNVVDGYINFLAIPKPARIAPDGRSLLFSADRGTGLTPHYNHGSCPGNGTANGTCRELYLYRADATPHVVCVSCNPSGAKGTADATDVVHTSVGGSAVTYHLNHALSDDGERVFFSTAEALVPEDVNGKVDAYEYDVANGAVHLLSTGTDTSDSYFMDASRSGDDAFIVTRQRLVGWDMDGSYDLYDVRVGGGLPEPAGQVVCGSGTCRGPVSAAPGEATLSTPAAVGSNVRAKPKRRRARHACRRGFVRKRVHGKLRCVKAPKHKARRAVRHRSGR